MHALPCRNDHALHRKHNLLSVRRGLLWPAAEPQHERNGVQPVRFEHLQLRRSLGLRGVCARVGGRLRWRRVRLIVV